MLPGAHHLGRVFASHGHEVRLMSPEYVRPYVKAQKNDDRDAEGAAEAATRPTMRFVDLKSQDQLDMQTLHRPGTDSWERTALISLGALGQTPCRRGGCHGDRKSAKTRKTRNARRNWPSGVPGSLVFRC